MTECKTCSKEVAKSASTCPHCGAKLKMSIFGKIMILLGVFFLMSVIVIILNTPVNFKSTSSTSSISTTDSSKENQSAQDNIQNNLPLPTIAQGTNLAPATGDVVDAVALTVKYLKDHGYSIANATGGGNLAGAKIQLPNSFNAVINEVKIGELLKEKNELSKQNAFDFSMCLGQEVSIMTWGLDATADSPNGLYVFFLIHNDKIVGVWFEPNKYGEKNMTLSIFERSIKI